MQKDARIYLTRSFGFDFELSLRNGGWEDCPNFRLFQFGFCRGSTLGGFRELVDFLSTLFDFSLRKAIIIF